MKLAPPRHGFNLAWSGDLNPDVPTRSRFAPLLDRYCHTTPVPRFAFLHKSRHSYRHVFQHGVQGA